MAYRSKRTRSLSLDVEEPFPSNNLVLQNSAPTDTNSDTKGLHDWGPFNPPRSGLLPTKKSLKASSDTTDVNGLENCIWKFPPTMNSQPNSTVGKSMDGQSRDMKPTSGIAFVTREKLYSVIKRPSVNSQAKSSNLGVITKPSDTSQPKSSKPDGTTKPGGTTKPSVTSQPKSSKPPLAAFSSHQEKITQFNAHLPVDRANNKTNSQVKTHNTSQPEKMPQINTPRVSPYGSTPEKTAAATSLPNATLTDDRANNKNGQQKGITLPIARDTNKPTSSCKTKSGTPQNINGRQESFECNTSNNTQSFTLRCPAAVLAWKLKVDFDAKEEILAIDDDDNHKLLSGSIQPIDVWNSNGFRYCVEFNNLHQPIRKSGSLFVRFLGTLAKMATYCPISAENWHDVNNYCKAAILRKIREKFVIPDENIYETLALQRVGKCWRNWKCELKRRYYKPNEKTHQEHYLNMPNGYAATDWANLIDYWFSEKGQRLSQNGQSARALQNQPHTMGCGSYANRRADYEETHGVEMSLIELWEDSHKRKDGSFVQGTCTEDFLHDVKSKSELLKLGDESNCKSQEEIDEEAFQATMNGDEIPQRPQGYGFGVKKSDVHGVQGLLRKDGCRKVKERSVVLDACVEITNLKKKNEELEKENKNISNQLSENNMMLKNVLAKISVVFDAVQSGDTSPELIEAVKSSLHMCDPEVEEDAIHDDGAA